MDEQRAQDRRKAERARVEELVSAGAASTRDEQSDDSEPPDSSDSGDELAREGVADAVQESLRERLVALDRADDRLAAGTYGTSVQRGATIPPRRSASARTDARTYWRISAEMRTAVRSGRSSTGIRVEQECRDHHRLGRPDRLGSLHAVRGARAGRGRHRRRGLRGCGPLRTGPARRLRLRA